MLTSRDPAYVGSVRTLPFMLPTGRTDLLVPDDGSVNYCVVEIFQTQCYRPIPNLGSVQTIVDIGANIGLSAAYFRMIYPQAAIYAFEPDPRAFSILEHNARLIGGCQVFPFGLSEGDRQAVLYLGESPVNTTLKRVSRSDHPTRSIDVKNASDTLAALCLDPIDIIKIDTEGEELPILRSLAGAAVPKTKVIYLEFHSHADRIAIDSLLTPTHYLWRASIDGVHRGVLTYVHRDSPAMQDALNAVT